MPANLLGRKPLDHWRLAMGCFWPAAPVEVRTTKPGRLSQSEPRPYQTQEPIEGRPEIVVPVFMKVWAGSWLMASVTIERTMQMSSATWPKWGKASQISWPFLPYFLKAQVGPRHLRAALPWSWAMGWPLVKESGMGWPVISASLGLWSRVSRWLGPPAMQ